MNVLFVCTGNTCRSAMAEGLLKSMLENREDEGINVSSAGVSAIDGEPANVKAVTAMENIGINISSYKSTQLTERIAKNSDIMLTMAAMHKRKIINMIPECSDKVFTLREYANIVSDGEQQLGNLDIEDPYGMDYSVYRLCMAQIKAELEKIISAGGFRSEKRTE